MSYEVDQGYAFENDGTVYHVLDDNSLWLSSRQLLVAADTKMPNGKIMRLKCQISDNAIEAAEFDLGTMGTDIKHKALRLGFLKLKPQVIAAKNEHMGIDPLQDSKYANAAIDAQVQRERELRLKREADERAMKLMEQEEREAERRRQIEEEEAKLQENDLWGQF